jgi:iron complex transport system ATP-binding protein
VTHPLVVSDLHVRYRHGPPVVRGVSFEAQPGQILALIGPNGAGKSTLLKALVGLLTYTGTVRLHDLHLAGLPPRERARQVAYVPQRTRLTAPLSVRSVVDLGRFAHRRPWAGPTRADRTAVDRALEEAGVVALADRPFPELSGGEQQRVLLARALASEAKVLLLDEPTSSLDVRHVLGLHGVLQRLADRGCIVVIVLHDLTEVRQLAHHAVLLHEGKVHTQGPAAEVVSPGPIRAVYGVELIEGGGFGYRLPDGGGRP